MQNLGHHIAEIQAIEYREDYYQIDQGADPQLEHFEDILGLEIDRFWLRVSLDCECCRHLEPRTLSLRQAVRFGMSEESFLNQLPQNIIAIRQAQMQRARDD